MKRFFVYIGTYTGGDSNSEGIYVYRFDPSDGNLTPVGTATRIDNPSFLEMSPDGRFLYAVSEVFEVNGTPGGTVLAYLVDKQTGALTYLNSQSTHGACPCPLNIDRPGRYVVIANYMGGNLAVLPICKDGSVGPATDVVQHEGCSNVNPERQEGPHAHSITASPDNRFAIAADLGKDMVIIYKLDLKNGKLLPTDKSQVKVTPGHGPRHLDFHPNGRYVFLLNELGNEITAYGYDARTGTLKLKNTACTLPAEFDAESIAADIHVHPNGKFLYASNRGHDSIVLCSIDEDTGAIEVLEHQSTLGEHPRHFCIDPTGAYLLVANQDTNDIATFAIDIKTGFLSPTGQLTNVPRPVCLRFMPELHCV